MRKVGLVSLLLGAAALAVLAAAPAHAQRQSGIQCTTDGSGVLINKEVADSSWVITWRVRDGYTTGNVLFGDGSVSFLACDVNSYEMGMVNMSCALAPSCAPGICPGYVPLPEPVSIPCSFFSAPCHPIPGRPGRNSRTCGGTPPRYPYDSEASCADFAAISGCASYEYTTNRCQVLNCCTPMECP